MAAILTFPNTGVALAEDGLQQRRKQCIAYLRNKLSLVIFSLQTREQHIEVEASM